MASSIGKNSASKKTAKKDVKKAEKGAKSGRMIYYFGVKKCDGDGSMKSLLGGKGANLAQMTKIGLPVPPGFTITTQVCIDYYTNGKKFPKGLESEVAGYVKLLEKETGKKFGDPSAALLVSVRSGARDSMPGMMDTILNLGLNDDTVKGLAEATGNPRFAYDSYRRFIQMYGDVVMGVQKRHENEHEPFEEVMEGLKHQLGIHNDTDMSEEHLRELIKRYLHLIRQRTGAEFPQDPFEQLLGAVGAVFGSWMNERAILYRRKYKIPDEWGTAVNVQSMVFGNMGDDCATGVAFTRDPATGEDIFYGEYLVNAQGEDVVAGVRTPKPVAEMAHDPEFASTYKELEKVRERLEKKFGDVQDFEFTVEKKKLYMLQTRNGKRTALAYVKIAHDMVKQKLMTPEHAIQSADPDALSQLLAPIFDRTDYEAARKSGRLLTSGLPAGPGAATGQLVFSAAKAEELANAGKKVVLARVETSPEDLRGMIAAEGILTSRGGVSSHAALVARQMGKVCVAGAGAVQIDYAKGTLVCAGKTLKEGDAISINGSTGEVFAGGIKTADSELKQVLIAGSMKPDDSEVYQYYAFIMKLADKYRKLGLRTNADTPEQVRHAIAFGAEGIGLTRTEHMFFEGDRIDAMREMILADTIDARREALAKLLPYQREDFEGIFRALDGRPATIRFLDPPLHEFVPHDEKAQADLAKKLRLPVETVEGPCSGPARVQPDARPPRLPPRDQLSRDLRDAGPRRVRGRRQGAEGRHQGEARDHDPARGLQEGTRQSGGDRPPGRRAGAEGDRQKIKYLVGTMIEIPRGALTADEIAETAEFFSFGTNDLTQTCLGMSRDDMGSFLQKYTDAGIFKANPFASIDVSGRGQLMKTAVEKGRKTRKDIKLGICGEHGGDPHSVIFCHHVGLDYVSCSPFRLPVARLAAAQAALGKTY
jgi:pyruvate, orthophosphate dikinase